MRWFDEKKFIQVIYFCFGNKYFDFWNFATMEKLYGTLRRHLPFDKSFQRDPNWCGDLTKESWYRWFIFALAQKCFDFWNFATMEKLYGKLRRHLPFDKSFQRHPNWCGDLTKESWYRWFFFALAQNVLTFEILLLWKSRTVLCGAFCRLTKAFKGTQIDAVIWRKKVHKGDLFLLWHKEFWLFKFCYYGKAVRYVEAPFVVWQKLSKGPELMWWFDDRKFIQVIYFCFGTKCFDFWNFASMEKLYGTLRRHLPFDKSFQRDPNSRKVHTGDLFCFDEG